MKQKEQKKKKEGISTRNNTYGHIGYNIVYMKNSKSGITLVALVVTIVVLLILAGITVTMLFGDEGIINKAQDAADKTNESQSQEKNDIKDLADILGNALGEGSTQGFNEQEGMNAPKIGGEMVPVRWDDTSKAWYVCKAENTESSTWYNYDSQKWANVMMRDGLVVDGVSNIQTAKIEDMAGRKVTSLGSMFVWIPRYAYKINTNYHNGGAGINGSIDIAFLKGTTNTPAKAEDKIVEYNSTTTADYTKFPEGGYVVHPGFTYGQNVTGLWIAKFEASPEGATTVTTDSQYDNTDKTLQVKPSVSSWRSITIGNMYTVCLNYNKNLNSHMMKNSEWGVTAYFTQSKYGRNGVELGQNQCTGRITGAGPGTGESTVNNSTYAYDETNFETTYGYTSVQGKLASSTGNETGIYDLSGGAFEYVASYIENSYIKDTTSSNYGYGEALIKGDSKTKDVYSAPEADDYEPNYLANKNKYGDAIWEISAGTYNGSTGNNQSWNGDYSNFPCDSAPFFHRGGYYGVTGTYAGAFSFHWHSGSSRVRDGFRPVLVVL